MAAWLLESVSKDCSLFASPVSLFFSDLSLRDSSLSTFPLAGDSVVGLMSTFPLAGDSVVGLMSTFPLVGDSVVGLMSSKSLLESMGDLGLPHLGHVPVADSISAVGSISVVALPCPVTSAAVAPPCSAACSEVAPPGSRH